MYHSFHTYENLGAKICEYRGDKMKKPILIGVSIVTVLGILLAAVALGFGGVSRLLIESSRDSPSRNGVFMAKLSVYAAKQGFKTASKSITIQEQPRQSLPEPSASTPQITKSIATATTPKASGFNAAPGIIIISTIYFIKRRYN
jgi:hypothetical protein